MIRPLACFALALALTLVACGKAADKHSGGTADGAILPGSVSDAMLPLDSLRSRPPLAPNIETSGSDAADAPKSVKAVSAKVSAGPKPQTEATASAANEPSPASDGL